MMVYGRTIETVNLAVERGDAQSFTFRFKDGGSAMDLTGKTIVFRGQLGSLVITLTTSDGLTISTPSNGEVVVAFSAAQTLSIPPGQAMPYGIENKTDEMTLVKGTIAASGGING